MSGMADVSCAGWMDEPGRDIAETDEGGRETSWEEIRGICVGSTTGDRVIPPWIPVNGLASEAYTVIVNNTKKASRERMIVLYILITFFLWESIRNSYIKKYGLM
jgi:hypothetical protein